MKNIKVELLHVTPKHVLKSALEKPYSTDLNENNLDNVAKRVLLQLKHLSVAEHIVFNFNIKGISRLCLQELVRHRTGKYTVQSTRFTLQKILSNETLKDVDVFCYPKEFDVPKNSDIQINELKEYISEISEMFNKEGRELNDYAKYFLQESFRTELVFSIDMRNLLHFLTLRLGVDGGKPHFEIKHLANLILDKCLNTEYAFMFENLKEECLTSKNK